MTNTIHAHVSLHAVDCDGPIVREYVMVPDLCDGSGTPAKVASACRVCNQSFGWPHPFNGVVGRALPAHIGEFGDIDFHNKVVAHVVNTYSIMEGVTGSLSVTRDDDEVTLDWSEQTEEGGRSINAVICNNNDCDVDATLYRDIRAEQAGY